MGTFSARASAEPSAPAIPASTIAADRPAGDEAAGKQQRRDPIGSAIDDCRAWARRSMSQRTTPPANIADDVEIGR